jgi:hypothetical protein
MISSTGHPVRIDTAADNISIGEGAGTSLTSTDNDNIIIGKNALNSTSGGNADRNIAIGTDVLTTIDGNEAFNVAIGHQALTTMNNNASDSNTVIGYQAGYGVTTGTFLSNTVVGAQALDTSAAACSGVVCMGAIALGAGALTSDADYTVAIGYAALSALTTGGGNTAVGKSALYTNTTGDSHVAIGVEAGYFTNVADTTGSSTFIGYKAGYNNTLGVEQTFVGSGAGNGADAITASGNTCVGYHSGYGFDGNAGYNTLLGHGSGVATTTGDHNVGLGYNSGATNTSGSYNVCIGSYANVDVAASDGHVRLGSYGTIKYIARRIDITAADSADNSVIAEIGTIPALSIIKSVSCIVQTKSNLGTYVLNLSLSTNTATNADDALAVSGITAPEILGAGAANTYQRNSAVAMGGTAADIVASSGGTVKTVYYNEPTTTIVGTSDTYLYVCNAETSNGTTSGTQGTLEIVVAYYGIN